MSEILRPLFTLDEGTWDLHRQGPIDDARHKEKVKEAIAENLQDLVTQNDIITSDGKKTVRVPIRGLDLPKFRFDPHSEKHTGQGEGDSQVGDVIGVDPGQSQSPGRGKKAGDRPGIDYYEVDIEIDKIATTLFEHFELPNLKPKKTQEMESEDVSWKDIRKKGLFSNLDKKRMVMENIKRKALAGEVPKFGDVKDEDLRFRVWENEMRRDTSAAVIAMRDVSGSMGEFEKFITRSFYFWMVRFLCTKYDKVQIRFITHHTDAKEVDEHSFFTLGEGGGTRVSSAYQLSKDIISREYQPDKWNVYPFHFTDGDNWGDTDNKLCVELVKWHLGRCSLFGYGEIAEGNRGTSSRMMAAFSDNIKDPGLVMVGINDRKDVYPALRRFFHKETWEAANAGKV